MQKEMSALGQKRTHAVQQLRLLFDHLVGTAEQRRRNGETEHSRGLQIDDQLKLVRFDNWQLRRLGALKDAANIATGLTK